MFLDRHSGQSGEEFPPELQATLRAYRESLPDFEAGPEFMPKLWARIESDRKVRFGFSRLTRALVPVSACLCAMTFAVALLTAGRSSAITVASVMTSVISSRIIAKSGNPFVLDGER